MQGRVGCDLEFFFWEPVKLPREVCDPEAILADKSVAGTSTSFTDPYGQSIYGDADRFDVMRRHNPHLSFG
ncbi:hypothetical protein ACVW1C_005499 [Bradyrhizobium sp. USDA 4011]